MEPVEILQNIFELGKLVYERVQQVKAKREECQRVLLQNDVKCARMPPNW